MNFRGKFNASCSLLFCFDLHMLTSVICSLWPSARFQILTCIPGSLGHRRTHDQKVTNTTILKAEIILSPVLSLGIVTVARCREKGSF